MDLTRTPRVDRPWGGFGTEETVLDPIPEGKHWMVGDVREPTQEERDRLTRALTSCHSTRHRCMAFRLLKGDPMGREGWAAARALVRVLKAWLPQCVHGGSYQEQCVGVWLLYDSGLLEGHPLATRPWAFWQKVEMTDFRYLGRPPTKAKQLQVLRYLVAGEEFSRAEAVTLWNERYREEAISPTNASNILRWGMEQGTVQRIARGRYRFTDQHIALQKHRSQRYGFNHRPRCHATPKPPVTPPQQQSGPKTLRMCDLPAKSPVEGSGDLVTRTRFVDTFGTGKLATLVWEVLPKFVLGEFQVVDADEARSYGLKPKRRRGTGVAKRLAQLSNPNRIPKEDQHGQAETGPTGPLRPR